MLKVCSPRLQHQVEWAALPSEARCRAFTLVEMLVVLLIMSIMMMIIVPAMRGALRSNTLVNSGNMVVNMANMARQTAMSKNTMTALVVLGHQGTDDDYRALTVLEYENGVGWFQSGKWEKLNGNVVIDCNSSATQGMVVDSFLANAPNPFPLTDRSGQPSPPITYKGQQVRPDAFAVQVFLPNGSLQLSDQSPKLRLVEGHLNGNVVTYTYPARNGAAVDTSRTDNYYDITILGLTGSTKVTRP